MMRNKKSDTEVSQIYEEFERICPTYEDCVSLVPDTVLSALLLPVFAQSDQVLNGLGQALHDRDYQILADNIDSLLHRRKIRNVSKEYQSIFYIFCEIAFRSYLGTQYFFWKELSDIKVNPEQLRIAMDDETNQTDLVHLLPSDLGKMLSAIRLGVLNGKQAPQLIKNDKTYYEIVDLIGAIIASMSSIVWQYAEAIWLERDRTPKGVIKIFLSYARNDRKKVLEFKRGFERAGYEIWLDEKDILVGQPILDAVSKAISSNVDYTLLFLSDNSINSEWVKIETRIAYTREIEEKRTFLLPVTISACTIPAHLGVKKYAKGYRRTSKCIVELQDTIRSLQRLERGRYVGNFRLD